jgi:hypothetical protein
MISRPTTKAWVPTSSARGTKRTSPCVEGVRRFWPAWPRPNLRRNRSSWRQQQLRGRSRPRPRRSPRAGHAGRGRGSCHSRRPPWRSWRSGSRVASPKRISRRPASTRLRQRSSEACPLRHRLPTLEPTHRRPRSRRECPRLLWHHGRCPSNGHGKRPHRRTRLRCARRVKERLRSRRHRGRSRRRLLLLRQESLGRHHRLRRPTACRHHHLRSRARPQGRRN